MTSKIGILKTTIGVTYGQKNFYILKKLIGKLGKICTAKPPHLSLKQSSILLKVLTTASTSRMYVTSTCLWQTWLESTSVPKKIWPSQKVFFLQKTSERQPFIIGVSGSVAVGKSTTSRLLQILLSRTFEGSTVELVTTDGFLYPNAILKEQELLNRKGFPESYDMELLLDFLNQIKNNKSVEIPVYSHEIYDIVQMRSKRFYQLILSL